MKITLGEVGLYVTDIECSTAFYMKALGFEPCEESDPPGAWIKVRRDGITLLFFRTESSDARCDVGYAPGMTLDLLVDEFDAACAALEAAGAEIEPPRTQHGWRFTIFRDPDGIQWELLDAVSREDEAADAKRADA